MNKLRLGWYLFLIGAGLFFAGLFVIAPAFAVNATAINEIQTALNPELAFSNSFSVFWIIFFLIILAFFMAISITKREWREMVFFSIGALIISILLTLLFTSPVSFDYQEITNQITIQEIEYLDGNFTYNSTVDNQVKHIVIIPPDTEFRFAMVALFTGITLFNGLYSIFIVTNYNTKK